MTYEYSVIISMDSLTAVHSLPASTDETLLHKPQISVIIYNMCTICIWYGKMLLDLILRLYTVQNGATRIDGINLGDLKKEPVPDLWVSNGKAVCYESNKQYKESRTDEQSGSD